MSKDVGEAKDSETVEKTVPEEKLDASAENGNDEPEAVEEITDPLEAGPKITDDEAEEAVSDKDDEDYGAKSKKKVKKTKKKKSKAKVTFKKAGRGQPKSTNKKVPKEDEEYEVQDIVGHKEVRGNLIYKIRWKGYGPNGDSWEPLDTLNCPILLAKYDKKNNVKVVKRKGPVVNAKNAKVAKYMEESDNDLPSDDDEVYEVENILDVKEKRNGLKEFLVHWKGYSKADANWEPEENLNCQDLIDNFLKTYEEKKATQKTRVTKIPVDRYTSKANGKGRRSKRNAGKR